MGYRRIAIDTCKQGSVQHVRSPVDQGPEQANFFRMMRRPPRSTHFPSTAPIRSTKPGTKPIAMAQWDPSAFRSKSERAQLRTELTGESRKVASDCKKQQSDTSGTKQGTHHGTKLNPIVQYDSIVLHSMRAADHASALHTPSTRLATPPL